MPAVLSKSISPNNSRVLCQHSSDRVIKLLDGLGAPLKCSKCSNSCNICMLTCACARCVLRKSVDREVCDEARLAILQTDKKYVQMTPKQKKKIVYQEVKQCISRVTKKGSYKMAYFLGEAADRVSCCKKAFDKYHRINHTYVDALVKYHKKKSLRPVPDINESSRISPEQLRKVERLAEKFKIVLDAEQRAAILLPNTVKAKTCFGWMRRFFQLMGDSAPNRAEEIHLEPIDVVDIYLEYKRDLTHHADFPTMNYSSFCQLWKDCFPHVTIRQYKAVGGKCSTCAVLSDLRRTYGDSPRRRLITMLHALHRSTYMGERITYYERRQEAIDNPSDVVSMILDGMAQNHSMLPWLGNLKTFDKHIQQHIIGVLSHGLDVTLYRSFHNMKHTGNLSVYCWLDTLEKRLKEDGTLPETIYYQVDGGPDAMCSLVVCIAELLVAKGLCKRVVVTRLPVGHTHEDIDSLFAKIWKKLRRMHVITPQQYAKLAKAALSKPGRPVEVEDVFVVPDFQDFVADHCGDDLLARWKLTKWAQLQFTVEEVDLSEEFPLGVRTTYRAFTKDHAIVLQEDKSPAALVPLEPFEVTVHSHPLPSEERPSGGLYVLQNLPSKPIKPAPFIIGSSKYLQEVMSKVRSQYGLNNPQIVEQWEEWCLSAPDTDDVQEYIRSHPLEYRIPFRDLLFGGQELSNDAVAAVSRNMRTEGPKKPKFKQLETTDCVQWRGNGGTSHKVEPLKPLGEKDAPKKTEGNNRKRKRAPLSGKKLTKKHRAIRASPEHKVVKTKKRPTGRSRHVEVVADALSGSEFSDSASNTSEAEECVEDRAPSSRLASVAASSAMRKQVLNEFKSTGYCDDSELSSDSHSHCRVSVKASLTMRRRGSCRQIVESDDDGDGADCGPDSSHELSDEGTGDYHEEVGNSEGEVSDNELDDAVYEAPDDLGFLAIKPGPRKRVGSTYRDNTYIRIYGCASYYLNWHFKHVLTNVDYCIVNVVRNCEDENDSDILYYKCRELGSADEYDYIKCVDMMSTQKKNRIYEWLKKSPKNRRKRPSKKQQWPGWAIVDVETGQVVDIRTDE